MLRICLSAIFGAAAASALPVLPARPGLLLFAALAALLAVAGRARPFAAAALGFIAFCLSAQVALNQQLSPALHRNKMQFTAEIIDFPKITESSISLLVQSSDVRLPARLRLSWYRSQARPRLGDTWQFEATLRRPRGTRNPGGFDYEGWLHRERIGASGYVVSATKVAAAPRGSLAGLRAHVVERIGALLPPGAARAALLAITVGTRHEIPAAAWQRYAATGTSHLMAISGLHVGLAAAGTTLLVWLLGGLLRPTGNLRDRALLAAVPVTVMYAAIAGFAVPAQRALLMTVCGSCLLLLRRTERAPALLALAAIVVLAVDPLALLAPGFLLSFGAVALLLYVGAFRRLQRGAAGVSAAARGIRELVRLQAALLLGLLPLTGLLFGRSAWLAPLANLLVIPLFGAVTVPAALLGVALDGPVAPVGDLLLWLAWYSLRAAHLVIDLLAAMPAALLLLPQLQGPALLLLLFPCLWVVLPQGFPGRYLAWLSFVAVLLYRPPAVPANCFDLHTLDVGQGLSLLVRTPRHALLYDTGPAYAGGSSSAERVVLPFLAAIGVRAVDTLIVSHADQDHAGGLATLLSAVPVERVLAGEPPAPPWAQELCEAGQRWRWDGVQFDLLYPGADLPRDGNNSSCVLAITIGASRVLLTGDIEARAERILLQKRQLQQAGLVLLPHHGSRTSSTA
ncbi:MAG: DNA internalization-related competence protein ComEC/Rec2, partial [Woeseia sp.]